MFKESETLELKRQVSEKNDKTLGIEKSIVAFLNTRGGKIYVGIDDKTGIPIGNADTDEEMKKLSDLVTNNIYPDAREFISMEIQHINEKDIIIITINQGNRFYCIKKYGYAPSGCFTRIGTVNSPLIQ